MCHIGLVVFKHHIAVTYLFYYLITDFLYLPGCFLELTTVQPVLQSGRRRDRLLLAAQGRAWTQSVCPPVTPAAPQTVKDSAPRLTTPTPNKTRLVVTLRKVVLWYSNDWAGEAWNSKASSPVINIFWFFLSKYVIIMYIFLIGTEIKCSLCISNSLWRMF